MSQLAFHDLPAAAFPFTVEVISLATREVVWTVVVDRPGVLAVPALREDHGPTWTRVTWGDGRVDEAFPDEHP